MFNLFKRPLVKQLAAETEETRQQFNHMEKLAEYSTAMRDMLAVRLQRQVALLEKALINGGRMKEEIRKQYPNAQ